MIQSRIRLMKLLIFFRQGCCLCDSLKDQLLKLNFDEIKPPLKLVEIDIDRFDLYQNKYKKFDYEVPVIALRALNSDEIIQLPRVSPRLKDLQLKNWLQKNINKSLTKNF